MVTEATPNQYITNKYQWNKISSWAHKKEILHNRVEQLGRWVPFSIFYSILNIVTDSALKRMESLPTMDDPDDECNKWRSLIIKTFGISRYKGKRKY